jgi:nicotinate-nucleotide adenylyltransferase
VNRPGFPTDASSRLAELIGDDNISDIEKLRIEIEPIGTSSTEIRKKLKDGIEIKGLVPECVEAYIKEHGLYSSLKSI